MDPNNLDFGFGFDAALNSLSFTGGKTAMSDNGISLKNESAMESMLENKFKQYGFSVSQDVIGSDYITITVLTEALSNLTLRRQVTGLV